MNVRDASSKQKWWKSNGLVFVLLAVSLLLRLYRLDAFPLWLDESGHLEVASADTLAALLKGVRGHAAAMPLDYLALHYYLKLFPAPSLFLLRLPYAIYGTVAVGLLYLLGQRLFGKVVGLTSGALLSFSTFHIAYSQEVRFYALSVVLALWSTLLLLKALESTSRKHRFMWGLVSLLGLFNHYFFSLALVMQALYVAGVMYSRRRGAGEDGNGWRRWLDRELWGYLLPISGILIAGLAWLWWSKPLDVEYAYSSEIPLFEAGIATLASFGSFYLSAVLLLFVLIDLFNRLEGVLISCLAIIPFWLIVWLDGFTGYFYNPRQVLFCLPFFLLAAVGGINYYVKKLLDWFHLNRESVLFQQTMPAVNAALVMISWFANWSWLRDYYLNGPGYK